MDITILGSGTAVQFQQDGHQNRNQQGRGGPVSADCRDYLESPAPSQRGAPEDEPGGHHRSAESARG